MKIGTGSKTRVLAGAFGLLLTLALILGTAVPVMAAGPPNLHQFYGNVTIDSAQAPVDTLVEAKIGGVVYGNGTVDADGMYGWSSQFLVNAPQELVGQTITFFVAGQEAQTATFEFLGYTELNLSVGAVIEYWLDISSTDGGNVTEPGEGNDTYPMGTVVNLTAVADAGYCFVNWTGDVGTVGNATAASTTITMNGNYAIQANFAQKYTLNVSSGAGGTVTTPGIGAFSYCPGAVANLVAAPDLGYLFQNWTGDVGTVGNATAASTTITMNGNYTIQANFNFVGTHWLVVNTTTGGHVTQPGEGNMTQTAGGVVNLLAVPDTGYCFVNWTGDVGTIASPNSASTTITMNGDYTITANFVAKYTLTIGTGTGGTVTTPGVGSFTYCPGAVVNLVATANGGYGFVNWTGNVGTVANPNAASTTITMNASYTIQANFQVSATPTPTVTATQPPGGGGGGGATPTPTPTHTPTPTGPTPTPTAVPTVPPIPAPTPIDISGGVSGNGTVTQPIVYSVLDGQAVLNIAQGTIALTATGGPLQSISVTEVCFGIPPAPAGAYIIGCAYDYKPDGATFNPPITMTIKYDQGKLPAGFDASKLVIASYNTATSKWVVYPSIVDTVKHTVTAQISHFTLFAVYAAAPAVTPTPTVAPTPKPTVAPTPTPTPAAGGLSGGVIALIVILVVIVIGLAAYWFLKKRRKPPAPSTPTSGSTGPTPGPKKT